MERLVPRQVPRDAVSLPELDLPVLRSCSRRRICASTCRRSISTRKIPPLPISSPPGYAAELAKKHGLMKTLGWWHDTWALNEERIDEGVFLEDCWRTMQQEREILLDELKNDPPSLLVSVFTATDSVSHMFWRLIDPQHPRYDAALAAKYGDAIEQTYERMDAIVGDVMRHHEARRHADHRLRSRLPFLAQGIQHQHLAGAERFHDAQESRRAGEAVQP